MRYKNGRNRGMGSEIMPGRTERSADDFSGKALEMTHQLVRRAETKLVGLHANRSQLRRRIRALHYLLKTVAKELSACDCPDPNFYLAAEEPKFSRDASYEFERDSDTAVLSRAAVRERAIGEPAGAKISTALRRACRIALMESDQPLGCEQILQRIQRRESVCIDGFNDPLIAVAQELRAMLADGEVISKKVMNSGPE